MLIVISPAKRLDFDTRPPARKCTMPVFLEEARHLVDRLKALSAEDLSKLMNVSEKIAELNHRRYDEWRTPFTLSNAKQAVWAFRGDVYTGLGADDFDRSDLEFAQRHLRMLSGLYGVLKPLDLIQPYRLEMGTRFATSKGGDLYRFWGDKITARLNRDLKSTGSSTLVNLASVEYFRSVHADDLNARVVTPVFKERKNGDYRVVSFVAKRARGAMSRYLVKRRIDDPAELRKFTGQGYRYNERLSQGGNWVFTRG